MAENNQNLTVYQKLFYLFGQGDGGVKGNITNNKYSLTDRDLIVTKSKQDFEKEKLQLQQQKYLEGQWAKVESDLYQKSVFYETTRIASYMDYEAMEFTPEIAVALDIFSEESCLVGSTLIPLLNGENVPIKDLFDKNYTNFWVYGVKLDEDEIKPSVVEKVVYKGYKDVYKVTLDDDTEVICTPEHKWLGVDNKWVDTIKLELGTPLKSIYRKETKKGYEKISLNDQVNNLDNHRVVKIEYVGKEDVYDLVNSSVDSSFAVKCQSGMIISHNCTLNEEGNVMSVYSDSKRIKKVLEDLFFNIIDIHSNLPMWTRNTCKYGDNFVHLKIDYKDGIIGVNQLTNLDIERKESNLFPYNKQEKENGVVKKREVSFSVKDKNIDFNAWEVAHFRLLGDDRKLPYGTSVLEKVRRIWKQLLLAEDAMLVYRVTRAPERRVFKVYVGNIDDADVEAYVQKVANKFKRTQTADRQTGQTDIRYNTLAVDQDYFVPVRDPNASMPIETLPGASNLDQIADIQFIQRKMVTALRVPKTFLGFEDALGEGKNLALLDIRFARTINRVQQAMIQELNKIAIIHLYILGFHDELNNFKLVLNNPSTQGEMLKVEQWKEKVLLYKDLVSAVDGGIAPTSHTWAKKHIFNWSSDEILEDLEQQRLERAASKELEMTSEVIKTTGFFRKVDKLYGELPMDQGSTEDDGSGEMGDDSGGGADFGGGFGGGGADFGGDMGGGDTGGDDFGGDTETGFGESFRGDENIIDRLLLEGRRKNEDIFNMTRGIDLLLNEENDDEGDLLID